jgi:hypothetical protein
MAHHVPSTGPENLVQNLGSWNEFFLIHNEALVKITNTLQPHLYFFIHHCTVVFFFFHVKFCLSLHQGCFFILSLRHYRLVLGYFYQFNIFKGSGVFWYLFFLYRVELHMHSWIQEIQFIWIEGIIVFWQCFLFKEKNC